MDTSKSLIYFSSCFVFLFICISNALDNGLALTPPMGWLTWERFRCNTDCDNDPDNCISEKLIKVMADRLVADGYRDVGYKYIIIDDCWLAPERDNITKQLEPDPKRFPNGIKHLADYVHSKGLLLGIYEDFGTKTCAGYPGSEFFLMHDANTFASWEVDYVKFDVCNSDPKDFAAGFSAMSFYLNQTGRPMVYSCEWPLGEYARGIKVDYAAVKKVCNLWRNYGDITDSWESVKNILGYYAINPGNFSNFAGPGGWNDPDMLVIGNFGLSKDEQKVQMGMWSIMASPLIMSNDLRTIDNFSKSLLQNKRLIAINQDSLGIQGTLFNTLGQLQVLKKPILPKGSYVIAIIHTADDGRPTKASFHPSEFGLTDSDGYRVTELFDGNSVGTYKPDTLFKISVNPHGIVMYAFIPVTDNKLYFL